MNFFQGPTEAHTKLTVEPGIVIPFVHKLSQYEKSICHPHNEQGKHQITVFKLARGLYLQTSDMKSDLSCSLEVKFSIDIPDKVSEN